MPKPSTRKLASHPLVRLIVEAVESGDGARWRAVRTWINVRPTDSVVRLLNRLATNRALLRDETLANGEVPIVATSLLERYQDPSSIKPLLELLCTMPLTGPELRQWDALWTTLHSLGHLAFETIIERYWSSDDPLIRGRLAILLGDCRLEQDGIYEVLAAELPHHPCLMAAYLGTFSDSRALPLLLETFDQIPWNSGGEFGEPFAGQPMLDLLGAITEQEGELSAKQWRTYERAWQLRSPGQPPPSIVPPPDREPLPGPKSSLPATPIIAATSNEFHWKALQWYGTLRNTSAMLEVSPAKVHHYVCTMASVA